MQEFIQDLRKQLTPPQFASWQTLLLMSIFSVFLAGVTQGWARDLISSCGWIWLILSTWWFVYENKKTMTISDWFSGPWIVGALMGAFLVSTVRFVPWATALILWPPLSAAIAVLPNFIATDSDTKTPKWAKPALNKRQGMLLLTLSHLLIACWFQFYFVLQGWLSDYPSLRADRFDRSAFVVNLGQDENFSRGRDVLRSAEDELRKKFATMAWPEVERWLLDMNREMPKLNNEVQAKLDKQKIRFAENSWWGLKGKVTGGEYDLDLYAVWQGPSSKTTGYTITKACQISPQTVMIRTTKPALKNGKPTIVTESKPKVVGKIKCEMPSQPRFEQPDENAVGA
jgi:Family of unknown function (DUF5357)